MQKITKKASILIWAIFLSLMISVSFLSISTKITKNLKNNNSNNKYISEKNEIDSKIKSTKENSEIIGNKTIFIENKKLEKSLKSNESYDITFNKNSVINLEIINSGIIHYEFKGTKKTSGILTGALSNYETGSGLLRLSNYSGYTRFKLIADNKFEIGEKKYKIIENIGSKEIIKTRGVIK